MIIKNFLYIVFHGIYTLSKRKYSRSSIKIIAFAICLLGSSLSNKCHAQSQSYTGTIGVSLLLKAACQIGGTTLAGNTNLGVLAFDAQTTFFSQVDKQVLSDGSNGGGAITMTCSPGVTPELEVTSGNHDDQKSGGHNHALANGTTYIAYDLYTDSSFAQVVQNNTPISLSANGTTYTIGLFGRAFGTGSASTLPAGTYTDTINVTLSF
ncbi:spore coat U domain-containing protein [Asaia bogorensis]|uniref:Csu type fimbrial protein n=1 Tax=Asaia bogorensis TaxID=91915 RepID=UPI0013CEF77D|nr:spore coat U domain-containing protein [Asaia bogorensis]